MAKKNLIVLRCGDGSLHEKWLAADADYDVVLSYYGKTDKYQHTPVKMIHYFQGSKWEGLSDFFVNHQSVWQQYDAVWLPDDDIDADVDTLNRFFDLFHRANLDLAQPSLTQDSYFSWGICLQNTSFILRQTDFVEVMVPCFNQETLQKLYPTFMANKSGWGIEFLWKKILGSQAKMAIIDATSVRHTRPVSSAGNGVGEGAQQLTPMQEMAELIQQHQLVFGSNVLGGIDEQGQWHAAGTPSFTKKLLQGSAEALFEHINLKIQRGFYVEPH